MCQFAPPVRKMGELFHTARFPQKTASNRTVFIGRWQNAEDRSQPVRGGCLSIGRAFSQHKVYWCNVRSQPPSHVASFLTERAGDAAYVHLGKARGEGFMRALNEALVPAEAQRDPS